MCIVALFVGCAGQPDYPVGLGEPTEPPSGPDWVNLLDADHAPNWENVTDDKEIFEVSDGVLHIYGRTVYPLRYVGYPEREFSDFELHLEYKLAPGANSGVFLRSRFVDPVNRGFEIQILDDAGQPPTKNGTGAVYDVITPMYNMSRPTGQWNSIDLRVEGTEVDVKVNGWRVILADFAQLTEPIGKFETPYAELPLTGHVVLQDHGGEVWYRNILVREL